jgi:hypothetical protein
VKTTAIGHLAGNAEGFALPAIAPGTVAVSSTSGQANKESCRVIVFVPTPLAPTKVMVLAPIVTNMSLPRSAI